jgi:hypothetical protein
MLLSEIKKIDGIPVIVFITCRNRQQLILKIESKYLFNCSKEDNISYYNTMLNIDYKKQKQDFLFSGILELLNILPKLKFNKIEAKFTIEDNDYFDDLFEFDNIQTIDKGECCVCYDNTTTKTPCCKNFLCFKCNENIKVKETHHSVHRSCPMCRENILYINEDDDSDDDDDDD